MLNDQQIFNQLRALPEPLKAEVVHYMEFLQAKYGQSAPRENGLKRKPSPDLAGALTIVGDVIAPVAEEDWEANS